jgi:hypothetical protein
MWGQSFAESCTFGGLGYNDYQFDEAICEANALSGLPLQTYFEKQKKSCLQMAGSLSLTVQETYGQ